MGNVDQKATIRTQEDDEEAEDTGNYGVSNTQDDATTTGAGGAPGGAAGGGSEEEEEQESSIVSQSEIERFFGGKVDVTISRQVFELRDEISQIRRYFHTNPELSFKEMHTSQNIIGYLKELGLEVESNIGGTTGVVGTLHGKYKGNCILLRSDMDALPITEHETKYNKKYMSKHKGTMHACGHDAHMAILLGTARVLCKLKDYLHGSVKFLFQCAEEAGAGAKLMIEAKTAMNHTSNNKEESCDILKNVNQVYGLHVWSYIPFGKCIVQSGPLMAGCVLFEILLIGKGGHGAIPKGTKDSIVASAHLISQLHSVISRNILATERGVLTIGKIESGFRSNVISESARIEGTIRWFDSEIYNIILSRIDSILKGIETSFNVQCTFKLTSNVVPPVINHDEQCVVNVKSAIKQVLTSNNNNNNNGSDSNDAIIDDGKPTMVSEDFSYFLEKRPGCFFLLGCGMDDMNWNDSGINDENEKKENNNNIKGNNVNNDDDDENETRNNALAHHTPNFEINEKCLTVGTQILCTLVLDLLLPNIGDDDTTA